VQLCSGENKWKTLQFIVCIDRGKWRTCPVTDGPAIHFFWWERAYPNSTYNHRYCTNQCHNFICCHWRCQRSNSNKTYISNLCLFLYCGVQHILCCDFALFFFVLCTLCCQFLWIVLFWLSFGIIIFHVNFLSSHWLRSVCQFSLSHGRGW